MTDSILEVDELAADGATAMVVATLAQQAALPRVLEDGRLYAVLDADGAIQLLETPGYLDRHADERADTPRQIDRNVTVLDVDSLADYLAHSTYDADEERTVGRGSLGNVGSLEVWADLDARTIKAIIDGGDGWRKHIATLQLKLSREWAEWSAIDGKLLDQRAFAQFIEDHLSTIASPDGARLLDICQTLQATTSTQFKQQAILANGQRQFRYEETVEAKAGHKGDLTIPGELILALRPFQGAGAVPIDARFRFQIRDGVLSLGIKLAEPDKALEDAFDTVVGDVQDRVPVRVNHGRG